MMPWTNEEYRERYATDPVFRQWTIQRVLKKYHSDPEYRQKVIDRAKQRYARLKAEKKAKEEEGN